jgi:CheY-like chemotaxis protein
MTACGRWSRNTSKGQKSSLMNVDDNLTPLVTLYIEDNVEIRQIVQEYLDRVYGIEVIGAQSAGNGLELAERIVPDLILLDQMLPDMNGLDVCYMLRASPITAHIPVIMLSVDDSPSSIESAFAVGANGYLFKPIDFDKLRTEIERIFQGLSLRSGSHVSNEPSMPIGAWYQAQPEAILPELQLKHRGEWPGVLLQILRNAESPVRGAAVVALAAWQKDWDAPFNKTPGQQFFWAYIRHSLISSTPADAELRWREVAWVAYALMSSPERVNKNLEQICRDSKNAECRQWALRILIENQPPGATDLAAEALGDRNDEVRATAALTLAVLGSTRHIPLLTQALSDPSAGVREQAAKALAKIGGDMSQIALETALLQGVPEAAEAAANALALVATPGAVGALVQAAEERHEPLVLCQVAHAMGAIKNNKCRVALWKLSKHADEHVRKIASSYLEFKGR